MPANQISIEAAICADIACRLSQTQKASPDDLQHAYDDALDVVVRLKRVLLTRSTPKQKSPEESPMLQDLLAATSSIFQITQSEITSPNRRAPVAQARNAFCLVALKFGTPTMEVGKFLKRDRSSVIWAKKSAENDSTVDPVYAEKITFLSNKSLPL